MWTDFSGYYSRFECWGGVLKWLLVCLGEVLGFGLFEVLVVCLNGLAALGWVGFL